MDTLFRGTELESRLPGFLKLLSGVISLVSWIIWGEVYFDWEVFEFEIREVLLDLLFHQQVNLVLDDNFLFDLYFREILSKIFDSFGPLFLGQLQNLKIL